VEEALRALLVRERMQGRVRMHGRSATQFTTHLGTGGTCETDALLSRQATAIPLDCYTSLTLWD
jgi:hypothetical protein